MIETYYHWQRLLYSDCGNRKNQYSDGMMKKRRNDSKIHADKNVMFVLSVKRKVICRYPEVKKIYEVIK